LPNLIGAKDIFEVCANPKYFFYFMGIKFFSLDLNIKKWEKRFNANSITDLIMLNKINNYNIDSVCVPNMTVRQGKLKIFDKKYIASLFNEIKYKVKLFYKYDISIDEIYNLLKKCSEKSYEIYTGAIIRDPDTDIVKKFHLDVKQQIFYKYCYNIENLLDVGTGQLTDLKFWNKVNIKNVVGIEPSLSSIEKGKERLKKFGDKTKVTVINGTGNDIWKKNEKFKDVYKYQYDVITFQYTIHYMINDLDIVFDNILPVLKKGGKIIITCMNGNLIQEKLNKNKTIEIRNDQEPIFAITPFDDKYLVYFKGAYGVNNGSVESLVNVDKLISEFKKKNLKLISKKNFLEYHSHTKNMMSEIQKGISRYYMSLVFVYE
jgi:SAM-dependent methyltransferase